MSFDFFDGPQGQEPGLEEVVRQVVDQSFEFDQFENVDNKTNKDKSFNSSFFNSEPPVLEQPEKVVSSKARGQSQSFDFERSRNLSQISYMEGQSFRFEQPPPRQTTIANSQRYNKLQTMLSEAKKNNLNNFYRNLEQHNAYPVQDKFSNKQDFNHYRNQLKTFKRKLEDNFTQSNGNYQFSTNQYHFPTKDSDNPFLQSEGAFKKTNKVQPEKQHNFFERRPSGEQKPNEVEPNNMLPQQYEKQDDGFDFFEMGEEDINKEVDKYKEKQYIREAEQFFTSQEKEGKQSKIKKEKHLSQIREERPNLFEQTHEEQKMVNLLQNYEEMKNNFHDLMSNLKVTNTDQEKIIKQLKNLKQEYQNKESRQKIEAESKLHKRQDRVREKEQKQRKLTEIREQVSKAKEGDKDVLFLKINEKIESLQNIVRNAITQMNSEKQQKFIPKIINYYRDEEPSNRSRTHASQQLRMSGEHSNLSEHDLEKSKLQINDLMEEQLAPVRNMINELKDYKKEDILYNMDQFSSPLQLDLTSQEFPLNLSRDRSQQLQTPFRPPEGAKPYLANSLDPTNKYLRRCLTQKSSIIFESFEFYVTGKFLMTGNQPSPVLCEVRVANKCAVSLYDVLVVVFGPQAQEGQLQMRPPKLMYDDFKANSSFFFEVDLSKICLESGGFNVMISYKTDSVNKKKLVFKVVLPFVQLIKPQFIYEEQFASGWNHMGNELFVAPNTLDFKNIRSHEDLKLILPMIQLSQADPNAFSYGIMFHYPTTSTVFMLRIVCYVSGKASIHLKSSSNNSSDKKIRQEILDVISYLCFGSS